MSFHVAGCSAETTVAECIAKAWLLLIRCGRCDRSPVEWRLEELLKLPLEATLGQVAARATCSACGSDEGEVAVRQGKWDCAPGYGVAPEK